MGFKTSTIQKVEKKYKNSRWMYDQYIINESSLSEIATMCDCGVTTIHRWMRIHRIKSRTLSDAATIAMPDRYIAPKDRLWDSIDKKNNINECWEHNRYRDKDGYGQIEVDGKKLRLHRYMYEVFYNDTIADGEVVHHVCGNRSCCNPFHLVKMGSGEHSTLHHDGKSMNSGENNPHSKLTQAEVNEIRSRYTGKYGEQTALAKIYNIGAETINNIIHGRRWCQG